MRGLPKVKASLGKSQETLFVLRKSFALLSKRDQKIIILISLIQLGLTVLDVLSIALIGIIASLSLFGIQSRELPSFLSEFIEALGLVNVSFQMQIAILGIAAGILLIGKTLSSAVINKRILTFLETKTAHVMSEVLRKVINQPYDYLKSRSPADILFSLTRGISAAISGVIGSASVVFAEVVLLIVIFCSLLFFDPFITIISLLYFGTLGFAQSRNWNNLAETTGSKSVQSMLRSETQILNTFALYRELWIKNAGDAQVSTFLDTRLKLAKYEARLRFLPYVAKYSMEISLVVGAILLTASQFLQRDALGAISILAVFLAAATRISPSILRLQQGLISLRSSIGESENTFRMIDNIKSRPKLEMDYVSNKMQSQEACSLTLKDVTFRYQDSDQDVVNGISLRINKGEFFSLAGPSGNGKSTLLDLMMGALQPSSGQIQINGLIPELFIKQFSKDIGYVAQESTFINMSIRENLTLGVFETVSDDEIWSVLEMVGLKDTVLSFPLKLDTVVGERGQSLSTGQKQRLSFSRALITKPKLLFLDEPTSSLDKDSELNIAQLIKSIKGQVTIVMVAHRLETIKDADTIAYIENGVITRQGKFSEIF